MRPAQTVLAPAALGNVGPRPDSPPSSDDDDHPRIKHEIHLFETTSAENKTLQFLNDAISECDFEEDSDLCDYFEDSDMFSASDIRDSSPRSYPGESDHSYHKGKDAQLCTDHLGVQTPSDSGKFIYHHLHWMLYFEQITSDSFAKKYFYVDLEH